MIDLNKSNYDSMTLFDWSEIFKQVSQEDIYSFYINERITDRNRIVSSPFREDVRKSFSIFNHNVRTDKLMWKDHSTGDTGDVITLVQKLFNLPRPIYAVYRIIEDFKITLVKSIGKETLESLESDVKERILKSSKVEKKHANLGVVYRDWDSKDKVYWQQYGICKETLRKFYVSPVKYMCINESFVLCNNNSYVYHEYKDGVCTYKIYQPQSKDRNRKWFCNHSKDVHQGYLQLPPKGDLLLITKSLKDVMCLHDITGIASIAPQSETTGIIEKVMQEYKSRFKKIVCLFDNDAPGIKASKKFSYENKIPYILLPSFPGVKDFSDAVKTLGQTVAKSMLFEELNNLKYGEESDVK